MASRAPRSRDPSKWDGLSEGVRKRYQRNGITKAAYVRGDSLSAARGHQNTPERPSDALKNPERYPEYRKPINVIVQNGDDAEMVQVSGLTARQRSMVARHWNAVVAFIDDNSDYDVAPSPFKKRPLKYFKGKTYGGYTLETREPQLLALAKRVDLTFEYLYPKVA